MTQWQYATVEWIWDQHLLRVDLPGGDVERSQGAYEEVVRVLNELGAQGWEVAASVTQLNWIFWTLKRPLPPAP